jgi:uncharacterized membrane protein
MMIATTQLLGDMGWGDHMANWGTGWWILMAFLMVVFWGLVIAGIAWVVRAPDWNHHQERGATAKERLDRRLAGGEISPEEYRRLRETLGGAGEDADQN